MGGAITGQLLTMIPERFITASFGGSGIQEADPEMRAKLPPDKQGRDPQEDEASRTLRIHRAMDLGMTKEEAEKRAAAPPPAPAAAATAPRPPLQIDLTKLSIQLLAINGVFDRPIEKTTRLAREVKNFTNVVLSGKSHLTAIMAGYMPKEYPDSLVKFINANDPKTRVVKSGT